MPDLSKIPPWAWVLGAVGIGGALYLYKKHHEEMQAASEASSETASSTSELPPEPYPYSYGGEGGGGGALGGYGGSGSGFNELYGQLSQQERETAQGQAEFEKNLAAQIAQSEHETAEILRSNSASSGSSGSTISGGSGGGTPSGGTGTVSPPSTQSAPTCPSGFPHSNGAPSPHTCYKDISKSMTGPKGAKANCTCHIYQDGHNECQTVVNGKCSW